MLNGFTKYQIKNMDTLINNVTLFNKRKQRKKEKRNVIRIFILGLSRIVYNKRKTKIESFVKSRFSFMILFSVSFYLRIFFIISIKIRMVNRIYCIKKWLSVCIPHLLFQKYRTLGESNTLYPRVFEGTKSNNRILKFELVFQILIFNKFYGVNSVVIKFNIWRNKNLTNFSN